MQVMAEMQSKKSAAKADFHCKNRLCQKEFTGLDMNRLTNFNRINEWGEVDDRLTCDFCGSEVVEDESKKKVDPRQLPKTLNERLRGVLFQKTKCNCNSIQIHTQILYLYFVNYFCA